MTSVDGPLVRLNDDTNLCYSLSGKHWDCALCLFNTCLIRLMHSVPAINTAVHVNTHSREPGPVNTHNREPVHVLRCTCGANERLPAAQAVAVVEGDNVNGRYK